MKTILIVFFFALNQWINKTDARLFTSISIKPKKGRIGSAGSTRKASILADTKAATIVSKPLWNRIWSFFLTPHTLDIKIDLSENLLNLQDWL